METWKNDIKVEIENQALLKYNLTFISPPDFSSWNPHNDITMKYCGKVCVRGKSLGMLLAHTAVLVSFAISVLFAGHRSARGDSAAVYSNNGFGNRTCYLLCMASWTCYYVFHPCHPIGTILFLENCQR